MNRKYPKIKYKKKEKSTIGKKEPYCNRCGNKLGSEIYGIGGLCPQCLRTWQSQCFRYGGVALIVSSLLIYGIHDWFSEPFLSDPIKYIFALLVAAIGAIIAAFGLHEWYYWSRPHKLADKVTGAKRYLMMTPEEARSLKEFERQHMDPDTGNLREDSSINKRLAQRNSSINKSLDRKIITKVCIFIELPKEYDDIDPADVVVNIPFDFLEFADSELKLSGKLCSYINSKNGGYSVENLRALDEVDRKILFKNKSKSERWGACYRKTEEGYMFSILVEYA